MARKPKLIKVRLHDRNEDSESVWAQDLGPVKGRRGARRVRIANICFFHAKPTLHDVIVVEPDPEDPDYMLQWDRRGVAWRKIDTRIDEDGGRYAMIVDYTHDREDWRGLVDAVRRPELDIEGAWGVRDGKPGRAYLAVEDGTKPAQVMAWLADNGVGYTFTQIHPAPRKPGRKPKRTATKRPATKRPAAKATKRPAAPRAKRQGSKAKTAHARRTRSR